MRVQQYTWSILHENMAHFNFLICFKCSFDSSCRHYKLGHLEYNFIKPVEIKCEQNQSVSCSEKNYTATKFSTSSEIISSAAEISKEASINLSADNFTTASADNNFTFLNNRLNNENCAIKIRIICNGHLIIHFFFLNAIYC